jgi:MerR family transcriptional regulator, light-induced transcriptional regulator
MSTGATRPDIPLLMLADSLTQGSPHPCQDMSEIDDRLRFALTHQVIPRLQALNRIFSEAHSMNRHTGDPAFTTTRSTPVTAVSAVHLANLLVLLRDGNTVERHGFYDGLIANGIDFETICEDLLAVTARYLGDCWLQDRMSFFEVSASTAALQADLIWLTTHMPEGDASTLLTEEPHSALIFAYPGERHLLGVNMLAENFRRAGWQVEFQTPVSVETCIDEVRFQNFDLVAISLSRVEWLADVAKTISRIRAESRNRSVKVMIGGPAITEIAVALELGADATSFTGQEAVIQANMLVERTSDHPASRI